MSRLNILCALSTADVSEHPSVPIHTLGWGKFHDPSSLWLLSNHTGGSYIFVKDFRE